MEKVVLGLSGGVDSALAATILKERGFHVIGVYLENGSNAEEDARRVAREIGIDFLVVDIMEQLEREVIEPFVSAYLQGSTPIPCILCNPSVKFYQLFKVMESLNAHYVATGHYAKIVDTPYGKALAKASCQNDQSYMLYRLPLEYISRIILPLGSHTSKAQVREEAETADIHIAKKADSMEICFIPNDDYGSFIEARGITPPPGNFVSPVGKVLGRHTGIHRYTVGQRRGLNISAATRLFVSRIDSERNEIVLSESDLYKDQVLVHSPVLSYQKYNELGDFPCTCKVRHSKTEYPCHVYKTTSGFRVCFTTPARAPARGQSAVFYDGEIVIGGGFIE